MASFGRKLLSGGVHGSTADAKRVERLACGALIRLAKKEIRAGAPEKCVDFVQEMWRQDNPECALNLRAVCNTATRDQIVHLRNSRRVAHRDVLEMNRKIAAIGSEDEAFSACRPTLHNAWLARRDVQAFFDSKRGKDLLAEFKACSTKFGYGSEPIKTWANGGCSPFAVGVCKWLAKHGVSAHFVALSHSENSDGHAMVRVGNGYLDGGGLVSAIPLKHKLMTVVPCANVDKLPVNWRAGSFSTKITRGLEKALGPADKLFCPGGAGLRGIRRRSKKGG